MLDPQVVSMVPMHPTLGNKKNTFVGVGKNNAAFHVGLNTYLNDNFIHSDYWWANQLILWLQELVR
jgi:hypothetical protein